MEQYIPHVSHFWNLTILQKKNIQAMSWAKFDAPSDCFFIAMAFWKLLNLILFIMLVICFVLLISSMKDFVTWFQFPFLCIHIRPGRSILLREKIGNSNVPASVLFVKVHRYGIILIETCAWAPLTDWIKSYYRFKRVCCTWF